MAKTAEQAGRQGLRNMEFDNRTGMMAGVALAGVALGVASMIGKKFAMQAASAAGKDWDEMLKAEHRAVEALLDKLEQTDESSKMARSGLVMHIKKALTKHALQEENVVYPAMAEKLDDERAAALFNDHAEMKKALHALVECDRADPAFATRAANLRRIVLDHVVEEEELLDTLKRHLSAEENAALNSQTWREGVALS